VRERKIEERAARGMLFKQGWPSSEYGLSKAKAVPLHATKALGGEDV
jgi:hypothetical protein